MATRNDEPQKREDHSTEPEAERKVELEEAEEIRERGTLTPEARKQDLTSHLPVEETEVMYREEDKRGATTAGEGKTLKNS